MFKKGEINNPTGRPKGSKNKFSVAELQKAFKKAAKLNGKKTILEHLAEAAYKDNALALGLLKKIMPDLKSYEAIIGVLSDQMSPEEVEAIREKLGDRFNTKKPGEEK